MAPESTAPAPPDAAPLPGHASLALLHQVFVNTLGMAMHNAVNAQHNAHTQYTASTTAACVRILSTRPRGPLPPKPLPDATTGTTA